MPALIFVAWPIAEILVAILVANAIGILWTFVLLVLGFPVGIWAIKSQGRTALVRLARAVSEGRSPTREVLDGALVVIGGLLFMIPGFITDVLAIFCLAMPTRSLLRRPLERNVNGRFMTSAFRVTGAYSADVDSTAHDIDQPHLPGA